MNLIIEERGTYISLKSERLQFRLEGQPLKEVALRDLETLAILTSAASISVEAIRACAKFGVQIDLLDGMGDPYAKITSPYLVGTVTTRRAQMLAYLNEKGLEVAKHAVRARLRNQVNLLRYFGKYRREADPAAFAAIEEALPALANLEAELDTLRAPNVDAARDFILSVEGRGGVVYWGTVANLLPQDLGFPGRLGRGATDPVNACLNYGYGILYSQAAGALSTAGLEPFAGFLHTDRPGKPSLVLDFVEGFRAAVVDRAIVATLGRGWRPEFKDGKLEPPSRKRLAEVVLNRLEARDTHGGKRFRLKSIMVAQARSLALFLRDEGEYPVYVASW
ncbi:MAG: CRISPR-associated endonuclease Cas1 [Thermaceae bacterium]|nr:CRISPR-associated endonuclease Cas1 [Thermaceae bacterium]